MCLYSTLSQVVFRFVHHHWMVLISLSFSFYFSILHTYWEQSIHLSWLSRTVCFFLSLHHSQAHSQKEQKKASLKMLSIYSRTMKTLFVYVSYSCLSFQFHSIQFIWYVRDEECSRVKSSSRSRSRSIEKAAAAKNHIYIDTHSNLSHDCFARTLTLILITHTRSSSQHIAIPSISMYVYVIVSVLKLTISVYAKKRQKSNSSNSRHSNRMKRRSVCVCMYAIKRGRESKNQASVIL